MFFEDEKDIIKEGTDIRIDEDGTVTWEDVLNNEEDIAGMPNIEHEGKTVDLGDELELVDDTEKEVNDQELLEILNGVQANSSQANDTQNQNKEEDFDIDEQLANVVMEQNQSQNQDQNQEEYIPRKQEKKQTSSTSPLLIIILIGVLIASGIYYGLQYFQENQMLNEISQKEIAPKPSVQEEMNNLTQEDLTQRQEENIPVINEEEVNEVKPEEAKPEVEKKQVINVIPTGRSNPFMPIAKYAKTTIPDTSVLYDKVGVPKPPETYGIQQEETMQMMTIAVSGIMYDEVKPSAIITYNDNDYFVQKGDRLDNYKIIDIARNHVTIALGNNTYRANVGEEFKITSKFNGSAQFIPSQQGGGKQYYSVTKEESQSKKSSDTRYVSEEDITINTK